VKQVRHIDREALEFILEAARSNHPREFAGVLRVTGDVVTEILLLPGTLSSAESALLRLHMLPIDPSVCGTVHSHPSSGPLPSPDDFQFFDKFGAIHLIVAFPYDKNSWKAYNHRGEEIRLEVIG
jgi:proteasome lid subunit RPN8/RPN11